MPKKLSSLVIHATSTSKRQDAPPPPPPPTQPLFHRKLLLFAGVRYHKISYLKKGDKYKNDNFDRAYTRNDPISKEESKRARREVRRGEDASDQISSISLIIN